MISARLRLRIYLALSPKRRINTRWEVFLCMQPRGCVLVESSAIHNIGRGKVCNDDDVLKQRRAILLSKLHTVPHVHLVHYRYARLCTMCHVCAD